MKKRKMNWRGAWLIITDVVKMPTPFVVLWLSRQQELLEQLPQVILV